MENSEHGPSALELHAHAILDIEIILGAPPSELAAEQKLVNIREVITSLDKRLTARRAAALDAVDQARQGRGATS
ncbi:MAG: hypothetical protein ACRDTT_18590 [Pseudonocardiaceae bacterium]